MQAPAPTIPQPGEWHSYDDLFTAYPGYWVLIAFPTPLTDDEKWDIMGTRGKLLAFSKDHDAVLQAWRALRQSDKEMLASFFATEQEDDIILVSGMERVNDATETDGMDANGLAYTC